MKTAVLLHGTGGSNQDYFWFADTKQALEANDYTVWWPLLPNTNKPILQDSLSFLVGNMPELNEESVIVGHSSACPLILSLLERTKVRVSTVILVSGFYQDIDNGGQSILMLQDTYDWQKIRSNAKEIYLLNSDDDPWGCNDQQARQAAERLGAPLIVMFGQGHMGSNAFNQPYRQFPLVKKLLDAEL
ncbi:MAG TPA: alpha/beta hydrolase [Candidatus Saccharimonadales bacterium]